MNISAISQSVPHNVDVSGGGETSGQKHLSFHKRSDGSREGRSVDHILSQRD